MGDAIGGIAQGAGAVAAANANANASQNVANIGLQGINTQVSEKAREANLAQQNALAQQQAYQKAVGTGTGELNNATNAITSEANTANPMLAQESTDIADQNAQELQQGAGQMSANLATQGVRGGQAATLLNRGTGQQAITAQQNIDQLQYQDSATKQAQLMAYQAAIGQGGQRAAIGNVSY